MIIAKYTTNATDVLPTFNSGYSYTYKEVNDNGIYTVELYSDTDFTSCSFSEKTALLTVEYLKVTSNVTDMTYMFYNCSQLTQLDLSNWDTSSVTNMSYMFRDCSQLTQLDVSNWDTSNVTSVSNMFNNCPNLRKIKILNQQTLSKLIEQLPIKSETNKGYLFTNDIFPNEKYWESIIIKEKQIDLILPQPLRRIGNVSDKLYWDNDKGHYCIEVNINEDLTIKDTPQIINLGQYNEQILFYQREGTTVKIGENSSVKPKEITLDYKNIDDK